LIQRTAGSFIKSQLAVEVNRHNSFAVNKTSLVKRTGGSFIKIPSLGLVGSPYLRRAHSGCVWATNGRHRLATPSCRNAISRCLQLAACRLWLVVCGPQLKAPLPAPSDQSPEPWRVVQVAGLRRLLAGCQSVFASAWLRVRRKRWLRFDRPQRTPVGYRELMNTISIEPGDRAILSLRKFTRDAGIHQTTAWRWRRAGWLKTINIGSRQYITRDGLAEFLRRAEAGEFARKNAPPARRK
jgi:hypothetical protein